MLPSKNDVNLNRKCSKPEKRNDVSQYVQEIQSKLDVPQVTKGQRRIFKKDTSFMINITKKCQIRLV